MRDAFAQSRFARRCFAGGRTFALLILALATFDRAQAANDCDATAPVDNTIITCSGATVNANGTDGYGTNTDKGNAYNILSGASVAGTNFGLRFNDLGTVNNSGTISSAGANNSGVFGLVRGTVNNSNVISATGANSAGVNFNGTGFVINSGSISGVNQGVRLQNGEVTNTSIGTSTGESMALKSSTSPKCRTPARSRAEYVASALAPPTAAATSKSPTAHHHGRAQWN